MISKLEQITPQLFADESLTMEIPVSAYMAAHAPGVMNRLAPSTISLADGSGFPVAGDELLGRRKARQLASWMVAGRPPAGMKASATTRLCIVLRAFTASSAPVSVACAA